MRGRRLFGEKKIILESKGFRYIPKQDFVRVSRSFGIALFFCLTFSLNNVKASTEASTTNLTQNSELLKTKASVDEPEIASDKANQAETKLNQNPDLIEDKKFLITGNQRVDEQTILSYLDFEQFRKNPDKAIARATKQLLETELFSSVKIFLQNQQTNPVSKSRNSQKNQARFMVELVENPIILELKFVGNKKVNDEALQSEIFLKKRAVFSKQKLQSDLKRISEIYTKTGRFLTKIDPKIIQKDQNRIELIFDIQEGPKAKIGEIFFVGNHEFSDKALREEISTKQSQWWKFLSSSDSYDSDRIEFDKETLRRFYGNRGFADFSTLSAVAQINRQKDEFFISFMVEEGIRYNIGTVEIENHIEKLDAEILRKKILIKPGKLYNADLIEKSVDAMIELLSDKAYAFAAIEPVLKRNRTQKIIDIDFVIQETPRIYIDQIKISGNVRTIDEVIRRELRLREGDPYNTTKINRSKQRIENLGFFEKVEFNTKRIGNTDKINLEIEVKEKKTGELNLGVGYSTYSKFNINAGIRENNLFGTGQTVGFNAQKSFAFTSVDVSYTKPYLLDMPVDVGFDVFRVSQLRRNTLPYDSKRVGFSLNAGYRITEFLSHNVSYNYTQDNVYNPGATPSILTKNLLGQYLTSGFGQSLLYDRRDNRFNPTDGFFLSLSQSFNGIGGDIKTIKHEGSAGFYMPIFSNDFVAKLGLKGGVIKGLGQDVRSNYGFFMGADSFRGFFFSGIGPRAKINGKPDRNGEIIGGKIFYIGTAEFRFPLGLPKELGIYGILFSDNGVVKGVDKGITGGMPIADSSRIRSTCGFSLAWSSPMGPIRLDFAKILRREAYDVPQNFNFSVGTSF